MKTAYAAFRLFLLSIFLLPQTVLAEPVLDLPTILPRPADLVRRPIPPLPPLPQRIGENLDRDTWSSADGLDWGIKIAEDDDDYVVMYLSSSACERWQREGKRLKLRTLYINGESTETAACRPGVNKAQYMSPPLDAKDSEAILFKSRPAP
ncbi:hypothetical protein CQ050_17150 [Achromobacter sp. MYb9]|nr:hypothetical protein CQ050_17150 [Achromobacter sp. MYb9]